MHGDAALFAAPLAAALATLLVACGSTAPSGLAGPARVVSADAAARLLRGTWELVEGCGGIAYTCRPASALLEPTRYEFGAGTVTAHRDGRPVFAAPYRVLPGEPAGSGDERPRLVIGEGATDPRPLRVSFVGTAGLLLDEGCCDRYTFRYTRR